MTENATAIARFIRRELGCRCPEPVLRDISVGSESLPPLENERAEGCWINAGGRLLILVIRCNEARDVTDRFAALVRTGIDERDRLGCNRFRLVLATAASAGADPQLATRFARLPGLDERTHLHVIDRRRLPAGLFPAPLER